MQENTTPHQGQPIRHSGKPLNEASAVVILVHGRGASAESILTLKDEFQHDQFAFLAPQATNSSWYPFSFLAPIENNEPWLSSALMVLDELVEATQQEGIPITKTMIVGFSQGACLAMEYIARNPRSYGGAAALSGGLIGPPGSKFSYSGSLENTPVFIGCSDVDPHIPLKRVQETSKALSQLGADVTERIYPGMAHTVNQDEINHLQKMMDNLTA